MLCAFYMYISQSLHFFTKIEEQKMVVQFELENLEMKPDAEPALTDLIHAVSIS